MKKRKTSIRHLAWDGMSSGLGLGHHVPRETRSVGCLVVNSETQNGFVRGFITAGLVAAMTPDRVGVRESLRLALQGGTALAAGIAGANALDRRDYGSVLRAVVAGTAGLSAINYVLPKSTKVQSDKD